MSVVVKTLQPALLRVWQPLSDGLRVKPEDVRPSPPQTGSFRAFLGLKPDLDPFDAGIVYIIAGD